MSFKFTLLGLEFSSRSPACAVEIEPKENITMARKKLTPQQKKFKEAVQECHGSTKSKEAFGKCVSKKLSKSKKTKRRSKK
jgi:hypothetical protein